VPTRLYKIVHDRRTGQTMAYLMPNGPIPEADLSKHQVPMAAVEQATGMRFNFK